MSEFGDGWDKLEHRLSRLSLDNLDNECLAYLTSIATDVVRLGDMDGEAKDQAITDLLNRAVLAKLFFDELKARYRSKVRTPIPAYVREAVYERDGYQCTYQNGERCTETKNLSIDHIISVRRKGNDEIDNLRTMCKPHNSSINCYGWENK